MTNAIARCPPESISKIKASSSVSSQYAIANVTAETAMYWLCSIEAATIDGMSRLSDRA